MVSIEKLTGNRKLRGSKLRGLKRNKMNTPNFICENDPRNKINIFRYENVTPTHKGAAHAFLKIQRNSQNRIPRELEKIEYSQNQ